MTEEERRRCCLLGGCGCAPGGAEQRAAMRGWLLEKLAGCHLAPIPEEDERNTAGRERAVDAWIDELFAGAESA